MKRYRIHSFVPPTILEWTNRYHFSRGRSRSYLGSQACYAYFAAYNWGKTWCSMEELLTSPDHTKGDEYRSQFKIDAYMPRTYLRWLDTMDSKATSLLDDYSPDYIEELKNKFGNRLYMVRERSMHLKRAIIILYKLSLVWPDILWIDLESVRPSGYEWAVHNFQNIDYTLAYSNKIAKMIDVDFSKPPKIQLVEY